MTVTYLKSAKRHAESDQADTRAAVSAMLAEIKSGGEARVEAYARELDRWDGPVLVDEDTRRAAAARLPESLKDDIRFAHANIRRFAEAQMRTVQGCEVEILPGLIAGQRQIPVSAAGCYVPGGRYSHIASALMTITTAKVAGVGHITACSPPRPGEGIPAAILFAMDLCGADAILNLGGVQGVAAMAEGLYGLPRADILVGPGNQYVAEAKRILFGEIGIDMFAGPTDSMVLADETADPEIVAIDLVSQAEHGWNSPVWLATTDRGLAEKVMQIMPGLIDALPEPNASSARAAWADFAEVMLCDSREAMARVADDYAPEHLHVQAADLDWWLNRLRAYGSLFLGEETTVAYGDKASGPNHVLPTSGAARYTGGLSVHKFMKTVTWQRADRAASRQLGGATARISRVEGMEGHARAADIRLTRYAVTEAGPAAAKVVG
ncbi:sulfopropanediol 3-dehydrogenase [Limimaricola soesokkakensis]|uniref:Histidinol dehydrogenase homolog n=1 Tax=Limimaricola soesokkakensis TaxID=1343159 RepID=A0A1X6ZAQ5_9RHOB|nr:histidinol dehydrogenase [Limimaricola soesokkakensis]PSK86433.1 sulfopropanediol 3-dehydrogenase [Limimaricola soesokkakensis]SLN45990.1 Sulfopropanediol 3-dehydrogenase [Limimaricola soesokkakensis]